MKRTYELLTQTPNKTTIVGVFVYANLAATIKTKNNIHSTMRKEEE